MDLMIIYNDIMMKNRIFLNMKYSEIIRKSSGLFILRNWYGSYQNKICTDIELSTDIEISKKMLREILQRYRLEDISENNRKILENSINDQLSVEKIDVLITNKVINQSMINQPNYPPISQSRFSK
jgi:hypothetical protein